MVLVLESPSIQDTILCDCPSFTVIDRIFIHGGGPYPVPALVPPQSEIYEMSRDSYVPSDQEMKSQ